MSKNPDDDRRYLTAKVTRAGHQLDHVLGALKEAAEEDLARVSTTPNSTLVNSEEPIIIDEAAEHFSPEPPRAADFLLVLFATSKRDVAAVGCINESFEQDADRWGPARARRRYWAQALKLLWPIIRCAAGRALKWAVVADFIKRHTIG